MDTQGQLRTAARRTGGFTLIEVLLVIVIIGMLATVLIVTIGGRADGAKIDTTKLSLQKIEGRIDEYMLHIGRYPTEADGGLDALMNKPGDEKVAEKWRGPYVKSAELNDAWGNKFNYEPVEAGTTLGGGAKFKVWSNGPDSQSNTDDDIKNWTEGT
jgi:general secretion pathway protein G